MSLPYDVARCQGGVGYTAPCDFCQRKTSAWSPYQQIIIAPALQYRGGDLYECPNFIAPDATTGADHAK